MDALLISNALLHPDRKGLQGATVRPVELGTR